MICAELNHNPYLLVTTVSFNGKAPRINSQIEKYDKLPLKDWVQKVPDIFYNEMNGYDFDLHFIGTKSDYYEVKNAFEKEGISSDMVRLFHKNELEEADTKSIEIDNLISWLKINPNRKFDFKSFWEDNSYEFEGTYPYIIIRGEIPANMDSIISPERVEGVDELVNTDLTNTPIIIFIEDSSKEAFRNDLQILLERPDIRKEQLFFIIAPGLNVDQERRIILDLGVDDPQIVIDYCDPSIMKYIHNYPVTEYIRYAIATFNDILYKIVPNLEVENNERAITNSGSRI